MNKSKGNMYGFVTHTWNPIKGRCPHDCSYCYMKRWELPELRLDEKELGLDLGAYRTIFMGSGTDAWCEAVPDEWIQRVLEQCAAHQMNKYLFQSKNPARFQRTAFRWNEIESVFCATIESNRQHPEMGAAPSIRERIDAMEEIAHFTKTMITIEPIMDFDLDELEEMLYGIRPTQVNIGADSKGSGLSEPSAEKIEALISAIQPFTTVFRKSNLRRLSQGKGE